LEILGKSVTLLLTVSIDHLVTGKLDLDMTAIDFINRINAGIAKGDWVYWAITLLGNPKLVGTICLWNISKANYVAEVGYELHPDFQGKGIAQDALAKVI